MPPPPSPPPPSASDRIKVVVDTDIGTDPDDGLALAYLALHPRCELVGVTVVSGDVQRRAAVAEVLLRAGCGRGGPGAPPMPPIHCGRRAPLLEGLGQPLVQQYDLAVAAGYAHAPAGLDRPEDAAVAFLRDVIRAAPGEVVLLTLGPLSNVALLFALDPALPALCRDVVSMAGHFFPPPESLLPDHKPPTLKEWNVLVDRTAAGVVLAAPRPRHRFCGLDVTTRVTWTADEVDRFCAAGAGPRPELRALFRALGIDYARKKGRQRFHDPLAAAAVFEPGLCEWKRGRVHVDPRNGATSFVEGDGDDLVAAAVDSDRFFRHWLEVVVGSPEMP